MTRPRRHRPGRAVVHGPGPRPRTHRRSARSGCRRASPSSTPRRGTASRSTRPAAATAPATSARSASTGRRPITRHDVKTFTRDQLDAGWRLACLVNATRDLAVDVPPLTTRPKAATVGVGRQVILRPAIQKRYVELDEPTLADQRTDLDRLLAGDRRPRAGRRPARAAPAADGAARGRLQGHRGDRRRGAHRRRARRHHEGRSTPSPSTSAPPPSSPRCSTSPPAPRSRSPRCSTSSSRSAAT